MLPIVSFVGKSDSGKTTLLETLIATLSQRGYRVGTIKHHAHADFEIDYPGKDTWRHYQAGAEAVLISAPGKLALIERAPSEVPPLTELAGRFADVDLILTEGFMRDTAPKIEVARAARSNELLCTQSELSAVVTDLPLALSVPRFELDEVEALADFIEAQFLKPRPSA